MAPTELQQGLEILGIILGTAVVLALFVIVIYGVFCLVTLFDHEPNEDDDPYNDFHNHGV